MVGGWAGLVARGACPGWGGRGSRGKGACPHVATPPISGRPGGGTLLGGGGEEPPADFGAFYQSEESFAGPAPALYGSAYLKAAAPPTPGPALAGPAPAKADGPAQGECPSRGDPDLGGAL